MVHIQVNIDSYRSVKLKGPQGPQLDLTSRVFVGSLF